MRLMVSLVDAVVGGVWPGPPAGGETVMVTHSVVYVVVVEEQESVAALAAAFTAWTLWTAATTPPLPLAAEVLAATPLARPSDPSGDQASQVPPVG
jgi:hypothetical protein